MVSPSSSPVQFQQFLPTSTSSSSTFYCTNRKYKSNIASLTALKMNVSMVCDAVWSDRNLSTFLRNLQQYKAINAKPKNFAQSLIRAVSPPPLQHIIIFIINSSDKEISNKNKNDSCNKSQQDALFLKFILIKTSTRFGQTYCPSSGVLILFDVALTVHRHICGNKMPTRCNR
jgi:hypothetical protein